MIALAVYVAVVVPLIVALGIVCAQRDKARQQLDDLRAERLAEQLAEIDRRYAP